jgi:DNA-directed RNA polymerase sigma subunit (sigma70/sigma32)
MSLEKFVEIINIDSYHPTEKDLCEMLPIALHSLKPKTSQWTTDVVANMLIMRYGLRGNSEHTLQQLGDIYGRSGEMVRGIEAQAFRLIRRHLQEPNAN